jgi:hypothetical protein
MRDDEDRQIAIKRLVELCSPEQNGVLVSIAALNAAERLGPLLPDRAVFATMPARGPTPHARYNEYPPRLLESLRSTK